MASYSSYQRKDMLNFRFIKKLLFVLCPYITKGVICQIEKKVQTPLYLISLCYTSPHWKTQVGTVIKIMTPIPYASKRHGNHRKHFRYNWNNYDNTVCSVDWMILMFICYKFYMVWKSSWFDYIKWFRLFITLYLFHKSFAKYSWIFNLSLPK